MRYKTKYMLIHIYSVILGWIFKTCYWIIGKDRWITQFFFEKYKSTRRLLPGVTRGPGGYSTRMGATEAHSSTQDTITHPAWKK